MNNAQMPVNWFDAVVLIVILFGLQSGRRRGMSEEWLPCLQWIVIIGVGSLVYIPLGDFLLKKSAMNKTVCYVSAYVIVAIVIKSVFYRIKLLLPEKLAGPSDMFGSYEYYLGMIAGAFRHCCILMAGMALLNAPHYSYVEVVMAQAKQKEYYGSEFFPSLHSIQQTVFKDSIVGKAVADNAGNLLIALNKADGKTHKH